MDVHCANRERLIYGTTGHEFIVILPQQIFLQVKNQEFCQRMAVNADDTNFCL